MTAREQLAARRLKAVQNHKQKAPWFPTVSFLPICPHAISSQAAVPRALKQRKGTISVSVGNILFAAPAGPKDINGCKINSSSCVCSVFLSQPLGAVTLRLMNYSTFPSGFVKAMLQPEQSETFLANSRAGYWQAA